MVSPALAVNPVVCLPRTVIVTDVTSGVGLGDGLGDGLGLGAVETLGTGLGVTTALS